MSRSGNGEGTISRRKDGCWEGLGDHYQDQGLIFTNDTGAPLNPSNLRQRSFSPLLKRAGFRTCASTIYGTPARRCSCRGVSTRRSSRNYRVTPPKRLPLTPTLT